MSALHCVVVFALFHGYLPLPGACTGQTCCALLHVWTAADAHPIV